MSSIVSKLKVKNATISAVVTRADGSIEDLGVVSYRDANPFKTLGWYLVHPRQAVAKISKFLHWTKGTAK